MNSSRSAALAQNLNDVNLSPVSKFESVLRSLNEPARRVLKLQPVLALARSVSWVDWERPTSQQIEFSLSVLTHFPDKDALNRTLSVFEDAIKIPCNEEGARLLLAGFYDQFSGNREAVIAATLATLNLTADARLDDVENITEPAVVSAEMLAAAIIKIREARDTFHPLPFRFAEETTKARRIFRDVHERLQHISDLYLQAGWIKDDLTGQASGRTSGDLDDELPDIDRGPALVHGSKR